ncbi:MAG TPA: carboxypeptidase-like regulatory domain-containing protein [Blastocatellia bacterium]
MLAAVVLFESGPWSVVSAINTPYNLAAYALAVVLILVLRARQKGKPIPSPAWGVIALLVLIPTGFSLYQEIIKTGPKETIYRVRVTVLNDQKLPIEDARVWSSIGGEPMKVAGGWHFEIPSAKRPQDGKLEIFASQENAYLKGSYELQLGADFNPAVVIHLNRDTSAKIRGQVVDSRGRAVAGARVFVVGYEDDAVITKEGGNFELPAHAAAGQSIELYAEKRGYGVAYLNHLVSDDAMILQLKR